MAIHYVHISENIVDQLELINKCKLGLWKLTYVRTLRRVLQSKYRGFQIRKTKHEKTSRGSNFFSYGANVNL